MDHPPGFHAWQCYVGKKTSHGSSTKKTSRPEQVNTQGNVPPTPHGCVRLVVLCDTRGSLPDTAAIPDGDILIHCGDFATEGIEQELVNFTEWLEGLPHQHKIVVAGDTSLKDLAFNSAYYQPVVSSYKKEPWTTSPLNVSSGKSTNGKEWQLQSGLWSSPGRDVSRPFSWQRTLDERNREPNVDYLSRLMAACVYLEDAAVEIMGLTFYGAPWSATTSGSFRVDKTAEIGTGQRATLKSAMAEQATRTKTNSHDPKHVRSGDNEGLVRNVPKHVDVLISHIAPIGTWKRSGFASLLAAVTSEAVRPRYHIFGEIFEGYGCCSDDSTVFVNGSITCPVHGAAGEEPNQPLVIDIVPTSSAVPHWQGLLRDVEAASTTSALRRSKLQAALLQSSSKRHLLGAWMSVVGADIVQAVANNQRVKAPQHAGLPGRPHSDLKKLSASAELFASQNASAKPLQIASTPGSDPSNHSWRQTNCAPAAVSQSHAPPKPLQGSAAILATMREGDKNRPGRTKLRTQVAATGNIAQDGGVPKQRRPLSRLEKEQLYLWNAQSGREVIPEWNGELDGSGNAASKLYSQVAVHDVNRGHGLLHRDELRDSGSAHAPVTPVQLVREQRAQRNHMDDCSDEFPSLVTESIISSKGGSEIVRAPSTVSSTASSSGVRGEEQWTVSKLQNALTLTRHIEDLEERVAKEKARADEASREAALAMAALRAMETAAVQAALPEGEPECCGGKVHLSVVRGSGLVVRDQNMFNKGGSSDPYVVVELLAGSPSTTAVMIGKTDVVKRSIDPSFKSGDFTFDVDQATVELTSSGVASPEGGEPHLRLSVFDKDMLSKDDPMGVAIVPLRKLFDGEGRGAKGGRPGFCDLDVAIEPCSGAEDATGALHLRTSVQALFVTSGHCSAVSQGPLRNTTAEEDEADGLTPQSGGSSVDENKPTGNQFYSHQRPPPGYVEGKKEPKQTKASLTKKQNATKLYASAPNDSHTSVTPQGKSRYFEHSKTTIRSAPQTPHGQGRADDSRTPPHTTAESLLRVAAQVVRMENGTDENSGKGLAALRNRKHQGSTKTFRKVVRGDAVIDEHLAQTPGSVGGTVSKASIDYVPTKAETLKTTVDGALAAAFLSDADAEAAMAEAAASKDRKKAALKKRPKSASATCRRPIRSTSATAIDPRTLSFKWVRSPVSDTPQATYLRPTKSSSKQQRPQSQCSKKGGKSGAATGSMSAVSAEDVAKSLVRRAEQYRLLTGQHTNKFRRPTKKDRSERRFVDFRVQAGSDEGALPNGETPPPGKREIPLQRSESASASRLDEAPATEVVITPIGEAYVDGNREVVVPTGEGEQTVPHPFASSAGPRSHHEQVAASRRVAVTPEQLSVTDRMRLAYG